MSVRDLSQILPAPLIELAAQFDVLGQRIDCEPALGIPSTRVEELDARRSISSTMIRDALNDLWDWVADLPVWAWIADLPVWAWIIALLVAVLGRRIQAGFDRVLDCCSAGIREWFETRTNKREQRRAATAVATKLERVRKERVGRLFLQRVTPDDPGMIGKVVSLDARRNGYVFVIWENPPGRRSTVGDPTTGRPIGIEWRQLIKPTDDQRHITARVDLKSFDDNDGWVVFEALDATALPDGVVAMLFPEAPADR